MNYRELMAYEQTRLGQLLLQRGLVQPGQIARALSVQSVTKQLLGEILIEQGWLSERCLGRTLRLQRRLRAALGVAALVGAPMLAMADDTTQPRTEPNAAVSSLLALDEAALGEVSAGNPGIFAPETDAPGARAIAAESVVLRGDVSRLSWRLLQGLATAERDDLVNVPASDRPRRSGEDEEAPQSGLGLAQALAGIDQVGLGILPLSNLLGLSGGGNVQMRVSYR